MVSLISNFGVLIRSLLEAVLMQTMLSVPGACISALVSTSALVVVAGLPWAHHSRSSQMPRDVVPEPWLM